MNLVLLEPPEVRPSGDVTLSLARAAHLIRVLKVGPGSEVRVGVIDGPRGVGTVASVGDGTVELHCRFDSHVPKPPGVALLLALPRPKVMRRLWAQVAALGVDRIILTNAERVERNYFDTHILTPDCYRPLLLEGLQQARDTRLPGVSIHRQLKVLVEDELDRLFPTGLRLLADPHGPRSPGAIARQHEGGPILLAVGPEGGWNQFEVGLFRAHGFRPVGMGPRTLRTDTACVALLAIVHDSMLRDAPEEQA